MTQSRHVLNEATTLRSGRANVRVFVRQTAHAIAEEIVNEQ